MKQFLLFLLAPVALAAADALPRIDSDDSSLESLLAPDATVEMFAEGFHWSEGPVWFQKSLVFSDMPENIIYLWTRGDGW